MICCGVFGAVLERIAYRPLLNAPVITLILATVAVGQMMRAAVRILRGSEVSRFPSVLPAEPFLIAGVAVTPLSLSIIVIALLLVGGFMLFFRKTTYRQGHGGDLGEPRGSAPGRHQRQSHVLLDLGHQLGIGRRRGRAAGPAHHHHARDGHIGIKGFIGAILGGFTSIPGAIAGCFLLGVIENLGGVYVASSMKDVIAFCVLVLVLTVRPQGLFGSEESKRA